MHDVKQPAVYILSNHPHGTLYTGVTSNLAQRVFQHKDGSFAGFTYKYNCKNLVYYEIHESMESAIMREKQIKAGSRKKKIALVESMNRDWKDLYPDIR